MPFKAVTLTLDTAQYAAGDLLADTQLLRASVGRAGQSVLIEDIKIQDDSDQGQDLDILFLNANTSLGTENSAPNISDANIAAAVLAGVAFVAADYKDLGGARLAEKHNINIPLYLADGGSLYIGAISRGTGTYAASGLIVTVGWRYRS